MASLKNLFAWCKRHYLLVTFFGVLFVVAFGFVNIQILHMTSEPEFCHMCHPSQGFGPLAEVDSWEHSAHGEAGVSCLDCHGRPGVAGYIKAKLGGLKDTYMQLTISKEEKLEILENPKHDLVPDQQCLFCHTDEGNQSYRKRVKLMKIVRMRLLDDVKNPQFRMHKGLPDILTDTFVGGTHFDHAMHREAFDFKCRDCHFGLVHNPSTKTDRMNMCVTCHKENEGSEAPQVAECQRCHEAQFDMNKGVGARQVAGEPGLMWGNGVTCQDCHTGVANGVYRPTSETCSNCHDDSYGDIFNEWSSETKAEIADLREMRINVEDALKEADKKKRDTKAYWELYEKALYNFRLVRNDGTNGVHNRDFAAAILGSVKKDFRTVLNDLDQAW